MRKMKETEETKEMMNQSSEAELARQVEDLMRPAEKPSEKKKGLLRRLFSGKKKFPIIAAVALIALAAVLKVVLSNGGTLPEVDSAVLSRGDLTETLTVTGPVGGSESVDITSSLHAKLIELNVKEGDRVRRGSSVLAKIDDEELRREAAVAEGNYRLQIAQKEDRQRQLLSDYGKALQSFQTAETDYNRKAALFSSGALSQAELELSQNALNDARRELSLYRLRDGKPLLSDTFDIQIQNAKQELEKWNAKLESAILTAPIDGTVTRVNTRVGRFADEVEDKKPLITIENLEQLQMELLVSEYNIGKVHPGQEVRISADILGKGNYVSGRVSSISPTGEKKSYDSSERVIPVKISIDSKDSKLISGITAKAEIILAKAEDVYVVPLSAVGDDGKGNSVMQFVLTGRDGRSRVQSFSVETGIEGDMDVELKQNPLDSLDTDYEARYLTSYNSAYADDTEVRIAAEEGKTDER